MNMQEEMSKKSEKIWEYNSPKNVMRSIDSISEVCKKLIPIVLLAMLVNLMFWIFEMSMNGIRIDTY